MTDLVEKVARALCDRYQYPSQWWTDFEEEARETIRIVLEKAAKVLEDDPETFDGGYAAVRLRAIIPNE